MEYKIVTEIDSNINLAIMDFEKKVDRYTTNGWEPIEGFSILLMEDGKYLVAQPLIKR